MMMKFLKLGLTSVATVAMLTACGGGGGDDTPSSSNNKVPIADAGTNIAVFGTKKVNLDASSSFDDDGSIVEYTWTEGTTVLGKGETLNNLSFVDGEHKVTLTVKDNVGATSTDTLTVIAECMNADTIVLVNDANGTLNYVGANEESSSCYKINLSSNNSVETYMLYMNLYNGTHHNSSFRTNVKLYDENGAEEHKFYNRMYSTGHRYKEAFDISADGVYYIKVNRANNEATKYGFSIHPSLENGLVQDSDRELNDHFVMAAPITLNDAMKDINGSLNMTRTQDNSLKNTDNEDYYSMDFANAGTYSFYINLYNGTHHNVSFYTYIEIFDANGASVHKFNSKLYKSGQSFKSTFKIQSAGKYYIQITRANNEATKYGFSIHPSIANGLVQDSDRELNDHFVMAAPITLNDTMKDINGSLNMTRTQDNSLKNTDNEDYYSMDFANAGTYSFYINLYNGTHHNVSFYTYIEIFDANGVSVHKFNSKIYKSGQYYANTFKIQSAGKYYIRISRANNEATKYGFSIHPSVANGLVQNSDRELNDFMSMAAPINWTEITNSISGSVNVTRKATDSSIQNTDMVDYYAIDFDQTGSHILDFNLTDGTVSNVSHYVDLKLRDSVGTVVEEFPAKLYHSGQNLNSTFNIPSTGVYYLSIYRYGEATKYTYTIAKP